MEKIRQVFTARSLKVRYASCSGSGHVHAKVYLAEWKTPSPETITRRLAWGSLNASHNGFNVNAEVASFATLEGSQESLILRYFHQLWILDSGKVERIDTVLPGGVRLLLPEFHFRSDLEQESFQAWIQSGRLCHKYEPDQTFGRLSVGLRRPLPKEAVEKLFAQAGLTRDFDTNSFRIPYIESVGTGGEKSVPHWRAQFFVETWLGFWTSAACYRASQNDFVGHNSLKRKEMLDRIKDSSATDHKQWTDDFLQRIRQVVSDLKMAKREPSDFFEFTKGNLNEWHYRQLAAKQLELHRRRAHIPIFQERFTKGFVFPQLPRFRGADAGEDGSFEDFLEFWCESVLNSMTKGKCANRLAQVIRQKLFNLSIVPTELTEGNDLYKLIEKYWSQWRNNMKAFHTLP